DSCDEDCVTAGVMQRACRADGDEDVCLFTVPPFGILPAPASPRRASSRPPMGDLFPMTARTGVPAGETISRILAPGVIRIAGCHRLIDVAAVLYSRGASG